MHGFGGTDAEQDAQCFRVMDTLRYARIQTVAALLDKRKMEARCEGNRLQEVRIVHVFIRPWNCGCLFTARLGTAGLRVVEIAEILGMNKRMVQVAIEPSVGTRLRMEGKTRGAKYYPVRPGQ